MRSRRARKRPVRKPTTSTAIPTISKPRETMSMISLKSTCQPFRAVSVMEPAAGPRRVERRRQLLQLLDLLAQVVEQHVGHVHRETAAHHDAQRRKVLTVLREGVGRHLPAALAQRRRDVEHGEVFDVVLEFEGEHRQLVTLREELERAHPGNRFRRVQGHLSRIPLLALVALEACLLYTSDAADDLL